MFTRLINYLKKRADYATIHDMAKEVEAIGRKHLHDYAFCSLHGDVLLHGEHNMVSYTYRATIYYGGTHEHRYSYTVTSEDYRELPGLIKKEITKASTKKTPTAIGL